MAKWGEIKCARCEELETENRLLRDAVYIDDLTVTGMADDKAALKARIAELKVKLAQVTAAYRIEVMQRGPWVSHEDFDRHIREITGDHDE